MVDRDVLGGGPSLAVKGASPLARGRVTVGSCLYILSITSQHILAVKTSTHFRVSVVIKTYRALQLVSPGTGSQWGN